MLPAVIPVLVLGGLLAGAVRPSRIDVEVVGDDLVVRLHGKDALYALRRGMTIPLSSVKGIAVAPRGSVPARGLRLPGTGIPGLLRAGSFGTGAKRDFWLVRRAPELLVIELEPGEPYRRIVLEVPDPRALNLQLRPLTGSYAGTFSP